MRRPFEVTVPSEQAYVRRIAFAVQLLDAVTLARVSHGVKVVAVGLRGKAVVNDSGYFVWLREDLTPLQKVTIDPGVLPYESVEIPAAQLQLPLTTVELAPMTNYGFTAGVTGLRGTVIESRVPSPQPVRNATVRLRWLDDNSLWRDAPTASHTSDGGDFAAIARLAPNEIPLLNAGAITVRLHVRRDAIERRSADFQLMQGRVTDPSTLNALTFAWDELQP